ncbi:MAG: LacI family transcriptional regulator, partial [Planctomycetota bacterium]|nr:LacI family transcriptional regulator [Planctomycetota bacterium]
MAVTQQEIARQLKVSQTTVSLVLSGQGRQFAEETRRRILALADRLGYRRRQKNERGAGVLGCLLHPEVEIDSQDYRYYYQEAIIGMQKAAHEAGFDLLISKVDAASRSLDDLCCRFEAAVIHNPLPLSLVRAIAQRVPVVLLNWHAPAEQYDAVVIDEEASMRSVVEQLAALGHRRLAFVGHLPLGYHHSRRHQAFQQIVQEMGLDAVAAPAFCPRTRSQTVDEMDFLTRRMLEAIARMALAKRPTALVAPADAWALSLLRAAKVCGISIPGDLSLTGFDCIPEALAAQPRLATVKPPMEEMGRCAVRLLLERRRERHRPAQKVMCAGVFIPQESIQPL